MAIYAYNEEYVMRVTYEEGEIAGYERGETAGYERGMTDGRSEGYENGQRRNLVHNIETVMKNLNLSLEKACQVFEISVEDYRRAQEIE